jgi:glycosyltransferase involved in cell wall biosynthesis
MNHPLNVMQIILNLELAGAQEVVRTLAQYLQEDGCTVTVCAFRDGPLRSEIEKLGIKVDILPRPRHSMVILPLFLLEMWQIRKQLIQLINAYQVQIAQTHLLEVLDFLVLSLTYSTNLRVVLWTIHNVDFLPGPSKVRRFVYKYLYRLLSHKVHGFIAVSDEVRSAILAQIGSIGPKVYTITNGVDTRRYEQPGDKAALCRALNLPLESCLVMTIGRLTLQKGQCYLIKAASQVVAAQSNTHFLIIGEGELKESLQQQAQQANLISNIHFLGNRRDVPALLAAVDLFVLPSLWEGLSIALLEAMAAAKPIVATTVSGTNQVMHPGQTGLLVPPADSPALAAAILQLLTQPALAQTMGQAARTQVINHYSAQHQTAEHIALYHRLLDAGQ